MLQNLNQMKSIVETYNNHDMSILVKYFSSVNSFLYHKSGCYLILEKSICFCYVFYFFFNM